MQFVHSISNAPVMTWKADMFIQDDKIGVVGRVGRQNLKHLTYTKILWLCDRLL